MDGATSDWKDKWRGFEARVGEDLSDGSVTWGADRIEPGAVRRYCEPLELASPIHHDAEAARACGFEDIVAPATSGMTIPPMWRPGEPTLFDDAARDAQPARSPIVGSSLPTPKTDGFFATDVEMDFLRPVTVGERLGSRGSRLMECQLKETSVGRGAFIKLESEVVSERGDVVARRRIGLYVYDPREKD